MISLTPISNGLQAVLKRRNSKVEKEPVGARSSLTLPLALRRFSSTESLGTPSHRISEAVTSSVTRRRSFSKKMRKSYTGLPHRPERDACMDLDISIAKIKRRLVGYTLDSHMHISGMVVSCRHSSVKKTWK